MKTTDNKAEVISARQDVVYGSPEMFEEREQLKAHIRDLHDAATRFEDRAKRAEAQRDTAVAALRYAINVIYNETAGQPRTHWVEACITEADAAIAAATSDGN